MHGAGRHGRQADRPARHDGLRGCRVGQSQARNSQVCERLREVGQRERHCLLCLHLRPVDLRREGVRHRPPATRKSPEGATGGVASCVGGGVGNGELFTRFIDVKCIFSLYIFYR